MVYVLPKLPGRSHAARISVLWQRVLALQRRFPFDSKIDVLTANMLSPTSPTPKMKCYGAECRGLVPVVRQLSEGLLDPADATDRSVKAATDSLASCYCCLSQHAPSAEERLATHRRKFCALKVALEARRPDIFRAKPKLHLFQELCEHDESGRAAAHRTYSEEEFGGSMVAMARRRRGAHTASSVALQVLKFSARLKVPNFV